MCSNVGDSYPKLIGDIPAIEYTEEENKVYDFTDNEEQLSYVRYRFDIWDKVYVLHNHPNNKSFSNRDIEWLMENSNVKYFSIVKNNGNTELIYLPENFDKIMLKTEYMRIIKKQKKIIDNDVQKGYNKVIEELLIKTKSGLIYVRSWFYVRYTWYYRWNSKRIK